MRNWQGRFGLFAIKAKKLAVDFRFNVLFLQFLGQTFMAHKIHIVNAQTLLSGFSMGGISPSSEAVKLKICRVADRQAVMKGDTF